MVTIIILFVFPILLFFLIELKSGLSNILNIISVFSYTTSFASDITNNIRLSFDHFQNFHNDLDCQKKKHILEILIVNNKQRIQYTRRKF